MDIQWTRDLVICVSGSALTLLLLFIAVLAYLLYRAARVVLNSVEATSNKAQSVLTSVEDTIVPIKEMVSYVTEGVARPLVQILAIFQGVREGINLISKLFKKEKEEAGNG